MLNHISPFCIFAYVIVVISFSRLTHNSESSTKQVTVSSNTSLGIKGYRRFHANDSFIRKPIPCTHKEKVCFRYSVLYFPKFDACLPFRGYQCEFAGDKNEFLHGSGHLFATCPGYRDPCPGYRMAYDGRCYTKETVRDIICGCDAEPTPHFLGGVECRCTPLASPLYVVQPKEEGKCLIPHLLFPEDRDSLRWSPLHSIERGGNVTLNCSAKQARCFSVGKVWMSEAQGCFPLKERGPCPEEHLVALDGQAALRGRAEGICVHERGGCPRGQRRMAFDGLCYLDADLDLIRRGQLYITEYGSHVVTLTFSGQANISLHTSHDKCNIQRIFTAASSAVNFPSPPCEKDNKTSGNNCFLYEVEIGAPEPEDHE